MTDERIEELLALCGKATMWKPDECGICEDTRDGDYVYVKECSALGDTLIQLAGDYEGYWFDWQLVAAARTALPEALTELKAAREEIRHLRLGGQPAP